MLGRFAIASHLLIACLFIALDSLDLLVIIIIAIGIAEIYANVQSAKWFLITGVHISALITFLLFSPTIQIMIFFTVTANDTMAYFFGKYATMLPDTKIFPDTSENKTWRGFLAGIWSGLAVYFILSLSIEMPLRHRFMGLFLSLVAVLGDYLGSKYKRAHGLKDSGDDFWTKQWMFGHGGIYDRFGALAMASFSFWLFEMAKQFLF